jgi:hypothetical protein
MKSGRIDNCPSFTTPLARHRRDGRTSRRRQVRLLLVEDSEGRQLLSDIVADVQKSREAANAIHDARLRTDSANGGHIKTARESVSGAHFRHAPI